MTKRAKLDKYKSREFQVGQSVMRRNPGLNACWEGPSVIVDKLSPVTNRIAPIRAAKPKARLFIILLKAADCVSSICAVVAITEDKHDCITRVCSTSER